MVHCAYGCEVASIYTDGHGQLQQWGRHNTNLNRLIECGVRQEIWEWIGPRMARKQRTDPRRIPKKWLLRPCLTVAPIVHQATLWFLESMVFIWWIIAGTYRTGLHCLHASDAVEVISEQKQDANGGEISRGVLSRPVMLEHSTNGMNSKYERSSLVHITRAYKIGALTPLFFKPVCRHTHGSWEQEW
jgi:hypothetical protein